MRSCPHNVIGKISGHNQQAKNQTCTPHRRGERAGSGYALVHCHSERSRGISRINFMSKPKTKPARLIVAASEQDLDMV
jgi:hypothetical protein